MDILKAAQPASTFPTGKPNETDLALVNKLTRKELAADEVYVFSVKLCDNEVDRDGERFTTNCLKGLAGMFVGKTGMFDHSGKSEDQVMRVYETFVDEDPKKRTSTGEAYAALFAKAYLPRNGSNAKLIEEIDAGIKKEVSISCAVKRVKCSVCGKDIGRNGCTHRKGASYDGATCHAVLDEPTDAYEFSFVAVPAQPAAGVVKRRKQKANDATIEDLKRLAEDGRLYRAELLEKTLKAGATAMPEMARELLSAMCGNLQTAQLRQLHDTLREKAAQSLPVYSQLAQQVNGGMHANNEGFRV